ncbi:hypothetical protein SAY86_012695 [Trapa natans]|uniref:Uncharacterized protein n=1 Tax=Trapa natans TaxID=22666 RepID=A0AAN7RBT4_TRANT|nr:hypothetical protein SAY86_012695 [Trapa natans]
MEEKEVILSYLENSPTPSNSRRSAGKITARSSMSSRASMVKSVHQSGLWVERECQTSISSLYVSLLPSPAWGSSGSSWSHKTSRICPLGME